MSSGSDADGGNGIWGEDLSNTEQCPSSLKPFPVPQPQPREYIPVNPTNPFYSGLPSVTPLPRTDLVGPGGDTLIERIQRYNPTSTSPGRADSRGRGSPRGSGPRGRGRPRRDTSYYKKTPRYCFPERPDYGPVRFIAAGEGDKMAPPDEADQVQMPTLPPPPVSMSVPGQGQGQGEVTVSEVIPGFITNPEEAKPELTMMDVAEMTRLRTSKKRTIDSGQSCTDPDVIKRVKITPEKTASGILNEICNSLEFIYEDVGQSPKDPKFLCRVTFPAGENGQEYVGEGRSKRLAKLNVAEIVLRQIGLEFPDHLTGATPHFLKGPEPEPQMKMHHAEMVPQPFFPLPNCMNPSRVYPFEDFTEDADVVMSSTDFSLSVVHQNPRLQATNVPVAVTEAFQRLKNVPNIEQNSLCALNSLVDPGTYEFEEISAEGPSHDRKFVLQLCLRSGLAFMGVGSSKKRAKQQAAKQALIAILGPEIYQTIISHSPAPKLGIPTVPIASVSEEMSQVPPEFFNDDSKNSSEYDITFSDYIARIVNDKYEEIMEEHQDYISQKVLAGIVMTRCNPMLENGEVIAVATGTKCVEGDFLSTDGLTVNDCHAEILATRCLRDFLYSEIENICCATMDEDRENSILIELKSEMGERFYTVKEEVKFHLYISTSPCGDARIFSPKGLETDEEKDSMDELEDSHPSKKNRGVLRAKVEAGEGTIPVDNLMTGPQTFDSIVQGNALYTMSCSDKVCRWNVVGVQGALLSNLMNPLYYSSITLGSLHHPVHFRRAVLGRIEGLAGKIPLPFKINRSHLLMISHQEKRVVKKSPNHAICWATGWSTPEILAASKGRCEPGGVASRLAKRMAFIRFLTLFRNQTGQRAGFADLSYKEAKQLAVEYQKSNQEFRTHMKEANLGSWISKPVEIDSFYISK